MRVHGEYKIKRRDLDISNWRNHKIELEEDFSGICGYCGKHFKATRCASQIDHFIPKKKYPDFENKYSNLILACKVCNNKKRDDWPSGDPMKNLTDDKQKGYVDPASDEYDDHFEKQDSGRIVWKTDAGKYMYKRLGFDYRPLEKIHQINKLYESIQVLKELKNRNESSYDSELLAELFIRCEDLRDQIHMQKE